MTASLFITIFVEAAVVVGYSASFNKLLRSLLFTSLFVNLITQSMLWDVLNLYFQYYLVTLLSAEFFIWWIEALLMYLIPPNRLSFSKAMLLSLGMNLASLAVGWLLPV